MHPAPETALGDSTAILLHPARGGTTTATACLAATGTGVHREGGGDAATRCWWGSLLRFRHGSSPESGSAPSGLQATGGAAGTWPGARTRHPMKGSLGPGGQTASDLRGAGSP